MAQTSAERQRAYRQRQSQRVQALEVSVADLAQRLADALAENERLLAAACRHPAATVQGGRCQACGTDVW